MRLPPACGPVSRLMADLLTERRPTEVALPSGQPVTGDRDVQLALWMAYELTYRGFDDVDDRLEWSADALGLRAELEARFERELRAATRERLDDAPAHGSIGDRLLRMVEEDDGPRLSAYLRRDASWEQMCDFLRERSVQQLKESDPQSFLLPRLTGSAKVALAEIQYDEYGSGRPDHLHQHLYAEALSAVGLDATYGAYLPEVSAVSLASANVMSLFGLHRRLLACGIGHFAAFEASSPVPSRRVAAGMERLGMPAATAAYFLEHVEADSVHEQVAARDLCGAFVDEHPESADEVLFGAACVLHLEGLSGEEILARWAAADATAGLAS